MLRKFGKSVLIYGLVPSFSKFIGIFLLPVYTRIFIPEEFGVVDLLNVSISLLVIFISLEIWNGVGRYFGETNNIENKRILVSTGLFSLITITVFAVLVITLSSRFLTVQLLQSLKYHNAFLLAGFWLPVTCVNTFLSVVMRYENKPWWYFGIAMVQLILKIVVTLAAVLIFEMGISGIYIGQITGGLVGSFFLLFVLRKYITLAMKKQVLTKVLSFSIPLAITTGALFLHQSINRFIILKFLSLEALGLYAVALKIASIFGMLRVAFRMAWEPFAYNNLDKENHREDMARIYRVMLLMSGILLLAITLFSREIMSVLASEEYFSAFALTGFLCIYTVMTMYKSIVEIGAKIAKRPFYSTIASIVGMLVNLLLLLVFLPKFGLISAAISLCIGGLVSLILAWHFSYKLYPIEFPKILTALLISLLFVVAIINNQYNFTAWSKLAFMAITLTLSLFYFKNDSIKSLMALNKGVKG